MFVSLTVDKWCIIGKTHRSIRCSVNVTRYPLLAYQLHLGMFWIALFIVFFNSEAFSLNSDSVWKYLAIRKEQRGIFLIRSLHFKWRLQEEMLLFLINALVLFSLSVIVQLTKQLAYDALVLVIGMYTPIDLNTILAPWCVLFIHGGMSRCMVCSLLCSYLWFPPP